MNDVRRDKRDALQKKFLAKLDDRIALIRDAASRYKLNSKSEEYLSELHRLIHSLNGSSATYGLHSIAGVASRLEQQLSRYRSDSRLATDWRALDATINSLTELVAIAKRTDREGLKIPASLLRDNQSPLAFIVEDDIDQAEHISEVLCQESYRTEIYSKPELFLERVADKSLESPSVIIMDLVFPDSERTGIELIKKSKCSPNADVPVVVLSARDELVARLEAFRAGACRFFLKPFDEKQMLGFLDMLTARRPDNPYRVLIVDDDETMLEAHTLVLEAAGMNVRALSEPLNTLDVIAAFNPEIIVLDVYMPGASGPELAAVIREQEALTQIPIIFLSSETDIKQQLQALSLGGDDFLVKPIEADHLVSAVSIRALRLRQSKAIETRLTETLYERERVNVALNLHALVSVTDSQGEIIQANDMMCKVSGFTRDELLGQNHRILNSNQHNNTFYTELWTTITSGKIWHGEICNQRKNGQFYWVSTTITPLLDAEDVPYQYIAIGTDISQSKHQQILLERGRENLITTLESTADGILAIDNQGTVSFANKKFYNMWRLDEFSDSNTSSDQTLMSKVLNQLVEPEAFVKKVESLYRSTKEDRSVIELRDGRVFERYSRPMLASNDLIGRVWSFRDISRREKVQRALEESEKKFRSMASNIPGMVYRAKPDWSVEYVSNSEELTGFTPQVLDWAAIIHEDDRSSVFEETQSLIKSPSKLNQEYRIVRKDGQIRWVTDLKQSLFNNNGDFLGVDGVVFDITDRKVADVEIERYKERLRRGQLYANVGTWEWIIPTGELYWSERIAPLFGYDQGQDIETTYENFIKAVHPDDRDRVNEAVNNSVEHGAVYEIEHRVVWQDGQVRWLLEKGDVTRDEQGSPLQMLGVVQDITAEVEGRNALRKAREEAERSNRAKSEFLSSMSHELRTPMNAIIGFGQLLEYEKGLNDEQQQFVHEICKAGEHLLELINEVLNLAKIESGTIDMVLKPVNLDSLIDECIMLVSTLAEKKAITIRYAANNTLAVCADRIRLKQALLNLMSNAIKYNCEGGSVDINIELVNPSSVRLKITDTGPGVAQNRFVELFQPFNRLDAENSKVEGTGIGLTLTKKLVELMGGSVGVSSELGVGSTFWIELPLAKEKPLQEFLGLPYGNRVAKTNDAPVFTGEVRVLYIEDNITNQHLMKGVLSRVNEITLTLADNAEQGIELCRRERPDVVLMDMLLPEMNGLEATELLKGLPETRAIPVIGVSANATDQDRAAALSVGMVDYISKPFRLNDILSAIDRAIK